MIARTQRCGEAGARRPGTRCTMQHTISLGSSSFLVALLDTLFPSRVAASSFQVLSKHHSLQDAVHGSFHAGIFQRRHLPRRSRPDPSFRATQVFVVQHHPGRRRNASTFAPTSYEDSLTKLQADSVFSGISTFGRLPYVPCLASKDEAFDIAFIGELQACVKAASAAH